MQKQKTEEFDKFFKFPFDPIKVFRFYMKDIQDYSETKRKILFYIAQRFDQEGNIYLIVNVVVEFFLKKTENCQVMILSLIDSIIHEIRPVKAGVQSKTKNFLYFLKRSLVKMAMKSFNQEKNLRIKFKFEYYLKKWLRNELITVKKFLNIMGIVAYGPSNMK